jgi:hypothetical protein
MSTMKAAVIVLTAALLAAVSGCSLGIPSAAKIDQLSPRTAKTTPAAKTTVKHQPFLFGVDLSLDKHYPDADIDEWGQRDIAYMANTLHVQEVGIDFPLVIPSYTSDSVEATSYVSPTVSQVQTLTNIAKQYKLKVQYRVLFWVPGRQHPLHPADLRTFFANMLSAETPYLQLAQQEGVTSFVAGTERTTIERDSQWSQFFSGAAKIYHGELSYAMWGGEPHQGGYFWGQGCDMPMQVCGVTFYPDQSLPSTASVPQIVSGWEKALQRVPASLLARTQIDEMGIPAVQNAYGSPWNWNQAGTRDDQVQANWYTAACTAARAENMRGMLIWAMPIEVDPAADPTKATTFTSRSATVSAIQACAKAASKS